MKTGDAYVAFIAAALIVGMNFFCASSSPANELNGLKAPASPESLWQPPDLENLSRVIKARAKPEADAQKEYELAELIDLAERANPQTRVAWDQAKQAAAAVGLAQSDYFPILALRASADYAREPVPVPLNATTAGYLDLTAQEAQPIAKLEWVLLDFGRRKAGVNAAKYQLLAANLGF